VRSMGEMRIYNTLSGEKEVFTPLRPGRVHMYVCGITAYDVCHIGHARSALVFDTIYRYLKCRGYEVVFVRNFTDVDDKIIKRAQEEGTDSETIAERYIAAFYEDMDRLGVERPTYEPRATQFIAQMIALIQQLQEKGHAYEVGGDVYFSVNSFPQYGKLSKRSQDELMAGARVAVDPNKRDPMDFALWKAGKPGEPAWPSPWGPGRPGWHIECSAMSANYLGQSFDIHGGGRDLVFPHHENEIAQSEAAYGATFARYWVHNGFVNVNQEKMSKSLGNFFTIRQVLERYPPEVLRLFLLSSHYRSPVDFSQEAMVEAERRLERLYLTLAQIEAAAASSQSSSQPERAELEDLRERVDRLGARFEEEMDEDFNTAAALGHLFDLSRALNRIRDFCDGRPDATTGSVLIEGARRLREQAGILGLLQASPADFFREQLQLRLAVLGIDEEEVERLILERARARKEKNWRRADEIREILTSMSIAVEDGPTGTKWRVTETP
jgi:cysteinyl-tRNA synthetase